jgi:hypothetical protein
MRFAHFRGAVVLQPPFQQIENAAAAMAAHGDDEWEAEFLVVGAVERMQPFEFLRTACIQSRAFLFARRFRRQLAPQCGLAGQFGVGA